MNNKLLKIIEKNDEEFDSRFSLESRDGKCLCLKYGDAPFASRTADKEDIMSHITQSRIKELGVLTEIIWKNRKNLEGSFPSETSFSFSSGYNQAIDNIVQELKDTIKKLK